MEAELPDGLTFDPESWRISGRWEGATPLRLRVTDGLGASSDKTYDVTPRESCWLAYVLREGEVARLHLSLLAPESEFDRTLPASPSEPGSVTDFQFSPDGRFLAYRVDGTRLVVALGPSWEQEQSVDFGGPVSYYAWSPDSSALAVVFTGDDQTWLGGLRADGADGAGGAAGSTTPTLVELTRASAEVTSEPFWVADGRYVAYHAPAVALVPPPTPDVVRVHEYVGDGFDPAIPLSNTRAYTESVVLKPVTDGFFAIDGSSDSVDYFDLSLGPDDPIQVWPHSHGAVFLAPDGRFTAAAGPDELTVYQPDESVWVTSAEGCPVLLSWSPGADRIACVANADAIGQVKIFDLGLASPDIQGTTVRGNYAYLEGDAYERRRTFSPSGRWFAFSTDDHLYLADLEGGSPRLVPESPPSAELISPLIELAFSPDEQWLLEQRGPQLTLYAVEALERAPEPLSPDDSLVEPDPCREDFQDSPERWCGNPRNPTVFAWSPDSKWAAFATSSGRLRILRPDPEAPGMDRRDLNDPGGPDGILQFGFQP
jgi:Tol biopolymer transport system component